LAHIVILSVPAYGHLNPVLPIARELVQRGHRVTIFNEASFEPLIRPTGADFVAYPPVLHLEDFSRTLKDGDLIAWLEMIFLATAPLLSFSAKKLRGNPPDLLVFDGVALWGEMLATKLRLPSVSISTTFTSEVLDEVTDFRQVMRNMRSVAMRVPGFAWAATAMLLQGPLNIPWRAPIIPRQGNRLTLMLTSKAVHPTTKSVDNPKFAFVGSSIEPATRSEQFDFGQLDGRPLLYVSLGTLHHGNTEFFRRVGEAFGDFPGQVLLSVGRGTDLGQFADLPANFIVAEAVPQLRILERTHVFLTHAGLNSMHESLWSGVPMVAVPQQFEQLRNAQSMAASGAGIVLDGEAWGKTTPAVALKAAVTEVSAHREKYAAAAAKLGDSLKAGGGYVEAANRIETALAR
jgi:hypothetical protein